MSCNLVKLCTLGSNLATLKTILFPDVKTEDEFQHEEDNFDNRWSWDQGPDTSTKSNAASKHAASLMLLDEWLSRCLIAISPSGDLMAIARDRNLAVIKIKTRDDDFNSKPSTNLSGSPAFNITCGSNLVDLGRDERITCLTCVPLMSQQRTSLGESDFTVMIIGFNTGYIRVYTETGDLLLAQQLHDQAVVSLKCQTYRSSPEYRQTSAGDQVDELVVVFAKSVIAVVDGFALFQTLRACRQTVAKVRSGSIASYSFMGTYGANPATDLPVSLSFKKWTVNESAEIVADADSLGVKRKNLFDFLVSASINRGASRPSGRNPPPATELVTAGENPFTGFFHADDTKQQTILSELSSVVVNKVKNFIPGSSLFFGGAGRSTDENSKPKIEAPINLPLQLGLYDQNRLAQSVCPSPRKQLIAMSDDFGRVLLLHASKQIAIRMWKGYREAQLGWVEVPEDPSDPHSRHGLFLVIYAPRRGLLEIWGCQKGPRVAAFSVGKNCRLYYYGYEMLGRSSTTPNMSSTSATKCYLLDYDEKVLYRIEVPFHCALTDRNSKKVRDAHLLKELKTLISETSNVPTASVLTKLVLAMKTAEIRIQAARFLLSHPSISSSTLKIVITELKNSLLAESKGAAADTENKQIIQMCARILQLLVLYEAMIELNANSKLNSLIDDDMPPMDLNSLGNRIGWKPNEVARCLSLLSLMSSVTTIKPQIQFEPITLQNFFQHFEIFEPQLERKPEDNESILMEDVPISIRINNSCPQEGDSSQSSLGLFLFGRYFISEDLNLEKPLIRSCIRPSCLLRLAFTSWLSTNLAHFWPTWEKFHDLISFLWRAEDEDMHTLSLTNSFDSASEYQDPDYVIKTRTHWRSSIRLLVESENLMAALIAALIIKSMDQELHIVRHPSSVLKAATSSNNPDDPMDDEAQTCSLETKLSSADLEWEELCINTERLNLFVKQIEDVLLLQILLRLDRGKRSNHQNATEDGLIGARSPLSSIKLSVASIMRHGPGAVSELVAEWAVECNIKPETLIIDYGKDAAAAAMTPSDDDDYNPYDLSRNSPNAVESGKDAMNKAEESGDTSNAEWETVMEMLHHVRRCFPNSLEPDVILANCAWECFLRWDKDPSSLASFQLITEEGMNYLYSVSSSVLKHNVACLLWRTYAQKRFQTLATLMEKMGKTPKDRICRKELGMGEDCLDTFVDFVHQLLNFIIETSLSAESEPMPLFALDDWWKSYRFGMSSSKKLGGKGSTVASHGSQPPLVILAVSQRVANPNLALEHQRLARIMQFVICFQLKAIKPISLFNNRVKKLLFTELNSPTPSLDQNSSPYDDSSYDPDLNELRTNFLLAAVRSIAVSVPFMSMTTSFSSDLLATQTDPDCANLVSEHKLYSAASQWFGKAITLGKEWDLPVDSLRRCFVVQLYANGCDKFAEEVLNQVSDREALGVELLIVAGQRLAHMFSQDARALEAKLPPKVVPWIKTVGNVGQSNPTGESETHPERATFESTKLLLQRVLHLIGEDHNQAEIAFALAEALSQPLSSTS